MRAGMAGEFQTVQPLSPTKWPEVSTCTPKTATVDSKSKFQLGYPIVGSDRLPARAKPKTSRLVCAATIPTTAGAGAPFGLNDEAFAGVAIPATAGMALAAVTMTLKRRATAKWRIRCRGMC